MPYKHLLAYVLFTFDITKLTLTSFLYILHYQKFLFYYGVKNTTLITNGSGKIRKIFMLPHLLGVNDYKLVLKMRDVTNV